MASALRRFLPSFGNGNGRLEHRADATVELLNAYEREALGVSVSPEDLATVESCSGLYERSLASAAVEPMALRSRPSARKCSLWLAGAWHCSGKRCS